MRPPDALRRRTHLLDSRADSIHTARHDKDRTVLSCLAGGVKSALDPATPPPRYQSTLVAGGDRHRHKMAVFVCRRVSRSLESDATVRADYAFNDDDGETQASSIGLMIRRVWTVSAP